MALRPLLTLLFLCSWLSARAAPKTGIAVYDFSATGKWTSARVTNLKEVPSSIYVAQPNGVIRTHRYATEETHLMAALDYRLENEAWRETNLYRELQSYSLREMLKRGYISKTLFDDVSYAAQIWRPSQIRFAIDWIEMPIAEARALYKGDIPWDRVIGGPVRDFMGDNELWIGAPPARWIAEWPVARPLRLVRTSIMVGLGQEMDLRTGAIRSLPLSWEIYPGVHPLAFGDARKKPESIPLMAEFSRALAGDGVTGGSLSEPIRVILSMMEAEARLRQGKPQEYLVFAHALDKAHARYFQRKFQMKAYTAEARDAVLAHKFHLEDLAPGKADTDRSVTVTTLAEVTGKVVSTALLSDWDEQRLDLCGGVRGRPETFRRAFAEGIWSHLQFPEAVATAPVCVQDFSPVLMIPVLERFIGWRIESEKATSLMQSVGEVNWDPNFLAPFWLGTAYVFYPDDLTGIKTQPIGVVRIDNLMPEAAHKFPDYLANVLLHVYEAQRNRILNASEIARDTFFTYIRTAFEAMPDRPGMSRPVLPSPLHVDAVLDHVIYLVGTRDVGIRDKLVALGGLGMEGSAYGVPRIEVIGGHLKMEESLQTKAYFVAFRGNQIRALTAGTQKIPVSCPAHLRDFFFLQAAAHL